MLLAAVMWLRTFLNLLRIAAYIYPGQIDFGIDVKMIPPMYPVFVGDHSGGSYRWDEDKKEPWAKRADGALFRSFGWRMSKAWFDRRTFPGLESFFQKHKALFDHLKNPWNFRSLKDIAPALDILSSATQIPDVGAKILLVYCCLEHLFVPGNIKTDNRKYVIGGINSLRPNLLPWFYELYNLRCDYAHKGFVLRNDQMLRLLRDSVENAMALLVTKLSVC